MQVAVSLKLLGTALVALEDSDGALVAYKEAERILTRFLEAEEKKKKTRQAKHDLEKSAGAEGDVEVSRTGGQTAAVASAAHHQRLQEERTRMALLRARIQVGVVVLRVLSCLRVGNVRVQVQRQCPPLPSILQELERFCAMRKIAEEGKEPVLPIADMYGSLFFLVVSLDFGCFCMPSSLFCESTLCLEAVFVCMRAPPHERWDGFSHAQLTTTQPHGKVWSGATTQ